MTTYVTACLDHTVKVAACCGSCSLQSNGFDNDDNENENDNGDYNDNDDLYDGNDNVDSDDVRYTGADAGEPIRPTLTIFNLGSSYYH